MYIPVVQPIRSLLYASVRSLLYTFTGIWLRIKCIVSDRDVSHDGGRVGVGILPQALGIPHVEDVWPDDEVDEGETSQKVGARGDRGEPHVVGCVELGHDRHLMKTRHSYTSSPHAHGVGNTSRNGSHRSSGPDLPAGNISVARVWNAGK